MHVTIFTPTYNRAKLLPRLFESLSKLDYSDFEWVIVDDGSTDLTSSLVATFQMQAIFPICYIVQTNKGKHIAINKGVEAANGELFFIVDSDDTLTSNALSILVNTYKTERKSKDIGGVSFRGCYADGTIVGNSNFKRVVCNSLDIRNVYGVTGDLVEVFTTKVMKEFPFPEIENEKFCPEVLVWNRIAQNYKLVYVNNAIYVVEYQKGGLTDRIVKIRMTSPTASMLTYGEMSSYSIPINQKIKAGINFWRFSFNSSMPFIEKLMLIGWRYLPLLPLGFVYYGYDMYKYK